MSGDRAETPSEITAWSGNAEWQEAKNKDNQRISAKEETNIFCS